MKVVELSGGVGGARMARGLAAVPQVDLTVVVNVGDDADNYGLRISPDLDTVVYTMAEVEGPQGWGRRDDTFTFNDELGRFGVDNSFRIGDADLALKLFRTNLMASGKTLSEVSRAIALSFGIEADVTPATDDKLRTEVLVDDGWIGFQEYFVVRGHQDEVRALRFTGADRAGPAPGVVDAIRAAEVVVVGPSNPPLSIWPILAIEDLKQAIEAHPYVVAVSPLLGGRPIKGPADRVMASLSLPEGNLGVAKAYEGLLHTIVIDEDDLEDARRLRGVEVLAADTRIGELQAARALAEEILGR